MTGSVRFLLPLMLGLGLIGGASCSSADDAVREPDRLSQAASRTSNLLPFEVSPGHIVLRDIPADLQPGQLVELVPIGPWPTGPDSRPTQAVLLVTSVDEDEASAILIGQRTPLPEMSLLVGHRVSNPELSSSKSCTWVTQRNDHSVRIAASGRNGVALGDFFFVLGEPAHETDRLGARIVALIRITEVTGLGAQGQIIHEMEPIGPEQIAVFAQHVALTAKQPEVSILFTNTDPGRPFDPNRLPPLAEAVAEYQAEFQFSNIIVEPLDVFIDPAGPDAVEMAWDLAPEEGFGAVVFGQERENDFVYNITTYGAPPGPVTSVGILPGGLPLPMPGGFESLSRALAPSFLATALTLRGDFAEAIYFLEYCLRHRLVIGTVAFHIREHLALRYQSIGRISEGLWLMTDDIETARDIGNPFVELNALSIREYLNRTARRFQREFDDIESFLRCAEDILPEESLLSERLERTHALARLDRTDDALQALEEVLHQARRQDSLRFEVSSALARATFLFQKGEAESAIRTISEVLSDARVLGESYPRYAHLLLAQYLTELVRYEEAMLNLQEAIDYALADNNRYTLASTYEMAANIQFAFERYIESLAFMRNAARLYGELDQYIDLARVLFQSGMLEMTIAVQTGDERFVQVAYNHLAIAAETFLASGDGMRAAQSYSGMGLANMLLNNHQQALVNLGRSIDLAYDYNDPATVVAAYQRGAEIYIELGNLDQARLALESARLWASTFGYQESLEEIDTALQALWNPI